MNDDVDPNAKWKADAAALSRAMRRVWELSGRPDPFNEDRESWDAFAFVTVAALNAPETNEAAALMATMAEAYAVRATEEERQHEPD